MHERKACNQDDDGKPPEGAEATSHQQDLRAAEVQWLNIDRVPGEGCGEAGAEKKAANAIFNWVKTPTVIGSRLVTATYHKLLCRV